MRFSAKAQYACIAMVELGAASGDKKPVQLKSVAEAHGISHRFLVQIMLHLKAAGLVESTRGALGGYLLARATEAITLADVICAIDQPPPAAPSALAALQRTPTVQAVSRILQEVQGIELRRLETITIADLVRQAQPAEELTYHI